jgi:hypothetical protein
VIAQVITDIIEAQRMSQLRVYKGDNMAPRTK